MTIVNRRTALSAGLGLAIAATVGAATPAAAATPSAHWNSGTTVFTQTNATDGNAILALQHDRWGRLATVASYRTGAVGTGAGLGSQGAVLLTPDRRHLLTVNAGSDSVTAFAVTSGRGLRPVGTAPSGGVQPISVTASRGLVYVVNAGATPTISGFRLDGRGLHPIAGSTRPLPDGAAGPAQISFTPDGRRLVVTLKATNRIDTFAVDHRGRTAPAVSTPSAGTTPFGFSFDRRGNVLVSNASGGAPGASTVTSYRIGVDGRLRTLTGPVATGQSAACWLVVTPDGRYAYVTNTGSASVSSLRVGPAGQVAVAAAAAATTGAGPIDAEVRHDGRVLYTLTGAGRSVEAFLVGRGGALTPLTAARNLPAGLVGLAVA